MTQASEMYELIEQVSSPPIPKEWDFYEADKEFDELIYGWRRLTLDICIKLWIFYHKLSHKVGKPDKISELSEILTKMPTWLEWLTTKGISDKTPIKHFRALGWMGGAHVSFNSGDNEWYTPVEYIDSAREVMGDIHLDPATTLEANEVIQAQAIYTKKDNALERDWRGNVWMNPPYASDLIGLFMAKLLQEAKLKNITAAIVLVNNATETTWFQPALKYCNAVCFPAGRIHFWNPEKETASPLQGQALLYFGDKRERFKDSFMVHGEVLYSAY